MVTQFAIVAIGRNEGERLQNCLYSAFKSKPSVVVYVDSGSTDNSVAFARSLGCVVVELPKSPPFTAARARNAGFQKALSLSSDLKYVQFVDGDCEVIDGWISRAIQFLDEHPKFAVACGRRRERFPTRSVYNQLIDIEWNTPIGEAKSCGGDALMRVSAFMAVKGFQSELIAGEEPELCVRFRATGWKIMRLDHEMTLHDAALLRFGQWWNRCKRAGYAFALGSSIHGLPPERHWVKESRSAWLWGLGLPLLIVGASTTFTTWALILLGIYPLQVFRIMSANRGRFPLVGIYAVSLVGGKFPEMLGQLKFLRDKVLGTIPSLIEYK